MGSNKMPVSLQTYTFLLLWGLPVLAEPRLSFNRDIRPILSDRCFACHGFDEKKREAELRLDTAEGAMAPRDSGQAIIPGQPEKSLLLARVLSEDPDEQMPPPTSHKAKLTPSEVDVLRRWIAQGAEYQTHWAFLPMGRPSPPAVEAPTLTPIDRFIVAELQQRKGPGLSSPANKERLLRRVTFDLTGLPPTVEQIDAFLDDESPEAWERVVDRLLQSPAYGERMASDWLDAARFADTHGYQMDRERQVWPYRDWVIRAFNDNLSFQDFVRWQLAGDLLPQATKDQRLATAFNRLHSQNEEGGIVEEEFRVAYVVDRVTTFGTVFLGLTLECTRCHDHKYDPITANEFYSLFAFFQNIPEPGQTSYFTPDMPTPAMVLSTSEQDARLAELDATITQKEAELAQVVDNEAFEQWLARRPVEPSVPGKQADYRFDSLDQNKLANEVDEKQPGNGVDSPKLVAGPEGHGQAGHLNGDDGFDFPGVGHFHRAQPFSIAIWIKQPKPSERAVVLHHSRAPADAASRGYDLLLEEGKVAFGLYYMWPGSAVKVRSARPIGPDTWTHVVATYDGSGKAAGIKLYLDGELAETEIIADRLTKDIVYGGNEPNLSIGYRFRDNGFKDGSVDDLMIFDRALTPLEAAHSAGKADLMQALQAPTPDPSTREKLLAYFLATLSEPWKESYREVLAARDAKRLFLAPIPELMVMEELPQPKPAFKLVRGSYDQPGDAVSADTPAALPRFPSSSPKSARTGRLASRCRASPLRPSHRQSILATPLRQRSRGNVRQFRHARIVPQSPRSARLSRARLHRPWVRFEETAQRDHPDTNIPAKLPSNRLEPRTRRRQSIFVAFVTPRSLGRDDARPVPGREWASDAQDRRAQRDALPTRRAVEYRDGKSGLRSKSWTRLVSPEYLHVLETNRPPADHDDTGRG
ncbi:DUF1549 domain-containing protein [bacterium]|nr:DUF1549 domain-containing protein [bacterium]